MPHDPMTLAEFERQAEHHLLIHVGQAQTRAEDAGCDLSDELEFAPVLRPFGCRLLAAERERWAQSSAPYAKVLAKAAEDSYAEAALLRRQHLPYTHLDERGSTLEFAERLIREMEDPK